MANVSIKYNGLSFEENPQVVTWIQLFLIKYLSEKKNESWIDSIIQELELNSKIDVYKYVFDEDSLNTKEKEDWALNLLNDSENFISQMTILEFAKYINDNIDSNFDINRLISFLSNLRKLIKSATANKQK